jgi:hypothetical protein
MRPLRWRSRYQTGDADTDRHNRAFVDCLNNLITAARQREHCREMEEFIARFSAEGEQVLLEHGADRDLSMEFGQRLLASLPLGPYGGTSCRPRGLCDLASRRSPSTWMPPPSACSKGPDALPGAHRMDGRPNSPLTVHLHQSAQRLPAIVLPWANRFFLFLGP